MGQFPEVDPDLDLPALDARTRVVWRARMVFPRAPDLGAGPERLVF